MRKLAMQCAVSSTCLMLCAASVVAADDAHGNGHAAEKVSLFSGDLGNAVWTLLIFFIVLAVLAKFAWGPILKGLQSRENFIRDSLSSAKNEREEAKRLLADYQSRIDKAREEASSIVEEGRRDAEDVRKRIHAEAKNEGDAMVERARREIEIARDDAVKKLYDQTVILAASAAGKIIKKELSPDAHRQLVDEALGELNAVNN